MKLSVADLNILIHALGVRRLDKGARVLLGRLLAMRECIKEEINELETKD